MTGQFVFINLPDQVFLLSSMISDHLESALNIKITKLISTPKIIAF